MNTATHHTLSQRASFWGRRGRRRPYPLDERGSGHDLSALWSGVAFISCGHDRHICGLSALCRKYFDPVRRYVGLHRTPGDDAVRFRLRGFCPIGSYFLSSAVFFVSRLDPAFSPRPVRHGCAPLELDNWQKQEGSERSRAPALWAPYRQDASVALSLPFPARAAITSSNVSYVPIVNPFLEAKKEAFWHTISPSGPWYKRCRYCFVAHDVILIVRSSSRLV
jgi:hypothetical protein